MQRWQSRSAALDVEASHIRIHQQAWVFVRGQARSRTPSASPATQQQDDLDPPSAGPLLLHCPLTVVGPYMRSSWPPQMPFRTQPPKQHPTP